MGKALTYRDLGVLRGHGFMHSTSSSNIWYGEDNEGFIWQAYEEVETGKLMFRQEINGHNVWDGSRTMDREEFGQRFPNKFLRRPSDETGD